MVTFENRWSKPFSFVIPIAKEEGQRGVGREQYERKPWLQGKQGEKLNN
jgi:hypothetical protein